MANEVTDKRVIGRLNGVHAPEGTVIAYSKRYERFLGVHGNDERGVLIRFSTQAEINDIKMHDPRSVVEYHGIPQRQTPFGMIRIPAPRPYVRLKPKRVGADGGVNSR